MYDPEIGRYTSIDPIHEMMNRYLYAGNNPTGWTDSLGLYREEVHRDLTADVGRDVRLDDATADAIADFDQAMDENWRDLPGNPFGGTQQHFRDRDDVEADLRAAIKACDPQAFGRHLHSYQDSFSHAGFSIWTGGHVPYSAGVWLANRIPRVNIPDPDDFTPATDPVDQAMVAGTTDFLQAYKDHCQCHLVAQE